MPVLNLRLYMYAIDLRKEQFSWYSLPFSSSFFFSFLFFLFLSCFLVADKLFTIDPTLIPHGAKDYHGAAVISILQSNTESRSLAPST